MSTKKLQKIDGVPKSRQSGYHGDMARPKENEKGHASIRVRSVVHKFLLALDEAIKARTGGDSQTHSDIVYRGLRLVAREIAPELLATPSSAELVGRTEPPSDPGPRP